MDLLDTLRISASGMMAERVRLQTVTSNLANARSTISEDGEPYRRKLPVFKAVSTDPFGGEMARQLSRVEVVDIEESDEPFKVVFDPGHPHANEDGYVSYPNVDVLREMVDMITTSRSYEANTNAAEATYQMATSALELAK
jgi:flagellar basal-body rod protein FlgC